MYEYMNKLEEFANKYPNEVIPATKEDVEALEKRNKVTFPKAYKEFLLLSGRKFYPLRVGHSIIKIEEYNEDALFFANEFNVRHLLPERFWVMAEVDGAETIFYFDLDDPSDDPPLYLFPMGYYHEKHEKEYLPGIFYDHISYWINDLIDKYEDRYNA